MPRWILLLVLLPLLDSALLVYSGAAAGGADGGQTAFTQGLDILSLVLAWAVLYFFLAAFYRLVNSLERGFSKKLLHGVLFRALLSVAGYLVFFWSFLLTNGFAPSGDAVGFLLQNIQRLPQHILQTSPLVAGGFFALSLLLAVVVHCYFIGIDPFKSRREGYRFAGVAAGVFVAWVMLLPHIALITPVHSALGLGPAPRLAADQDLIKLAVKRPYEPISLGQPHRPPVIIVLIESLRRDLLDMSPSPIPFLKSLTQDSILFDHAYATASHSNYADLAFWYSQFPLRKMGLQSYPKDAAWRGDSLFSAFKAHEYATAYISSQNEKWGDMINWLEVDEVDYFYHSENYEGDTWFNKDDKYGVKMLVEKGIATAGKIEDSATLEVAKYWIDSLEGRSDFMLGLNLQNTHFSYVIPEGGREPFQPADMDFEAVYFRWPEGKKAQVKNRYLNAVYNVDAMLGEFVAYLKSRGLWEECVFVVVGDSGEAFYEHGFGNHSGPMYEEVMRTFALIKPPASKDIRPQIFQAPLSHIDIAAATLDLLGMPIPDDFQGMSPFDANRRKTVYMHTNAIIKQNALIQWPWKLLHTYYPYDRIELYELEQDSGELRNLASVHKEVAERLDELLSSWMTKQIVYYSDPAFYTEMSPPKLLESN